MEKLVIMAQNGNVDSKSQILTDLKPLVISSIIKYQYKPNDMDDLIQDGYEVILNSIQDYDHKKGAYFLGFVQMNLRHFYLNQKKTPQVLSLNSNIYDSKEILDTIASNDIDILDRIIQSQGNIKLYKSYEKLAPRQKEVISLYYINGCSMKEIAEKLNLSYRSVVNTKIQGINNLKKYLLK